MFTKPLIVVSDLLTQFGGHFYAAGLTMELEKVAEFKLRFNEYVAANLTEDMFDTRN